MDILGNIQLVSFILIALILIGLVLRDLLNQKFDMFTSNTYRKDDDSISSTGTTVVLWLVLVLILAQFGVFLRTCNGVFDCFMKMFFSGRFYYRIR